MFCFPDKHAHTHIHVYIHTFTYVYTLYLVGPFLTVTSHLKAHNSNSTFCYIVFYSNCSSKYTLLKINLLEIKDTIWNFFSLNTVLKVLVTLFHQSDILILFE